MQKSPCFPGVCPTDVRWGYLLNAQQLSASTCGVLISRLRLSVERHRSPAVAKLHSVNGAIGVALVPQRDLEHAAIRGLEGFAVSALGCSRLNTGLDLGADLVARHFQVVGRLHADPEFGAGAKITREP